jgi:alcohol dehydrogenase class IV
MIRDITLSWPPVIEFGAGKLSTLASHLGECSRVFVLCDPPIAPRIDPILGQLKASGTRVMVSMDVVPEPPFEALERQLEPVREFSPEAVVGIGGGSAMDLSKVIAVLFPGEQKPHEVVGIGKVMGRTVKLITVSTTSGTGSEVTPIAVLTDLEQHLKKGVVSRYLIADVAIVDPELTFSVPADITAATGVDALSHCLEAYTNRHAHPIVDTIALEGIRLAAAHLETVVTHGDNVEARSAMSLASLYGGMCLGPVNTAATHALAYPLGGEYKIAHGISISVLLPFVMMFNLPAATEKYATIARAVGIPEETSLEAMGEKGILKIREISERCGIPSSMRAFDIPESAIPSMAEAAMNVTRLLENNPRTVTRDDAEEIFRKAYAGVVA